MKMFCKVVEFMERDKQEIFTAISGNRLHFPFKRFMHQCVGLKLACEKKIQLKFLDPFVNPFE